MQFLRRFEGGVEPFDVTKDVGSTCNPTTGADLFVDSASKGMVKPVIKSILDDFASEG
jgi:hypothetical protein